MQQSIGDTFEVVLIHHEFSLIQSLGIVLPSDFIIVPSFRFAVRIALDVSVWEVGEAIARKQGDRSIIPHYYTFQFDILRFLFL